MIIIINNNKKKGYASMLTVNCIYVYIKKENTCEKQIMGYYKNPWKGYSKNLT